VSTLKEKIVNKKTIVFAIILIVIAIVCTIIRVVKSSQSDVIGPKSGLSNIYANVSTSAIKGYDEGVEEFLNLAKKIKKEFKNFDITFSFSTFVPKPNTPFQWAKREDTKSLEKKQKYLEKELAKLGIESKFSSAKWDFWQALLSRGDENLTEFLIEVYKNGGKNGAYKSAYKKLKEEFLKAIQGFDFDEVLPWDFIEIYPGKDLLKKELNRLNKYTHIS
jgi:radical SAM superfamily enzyme YgiQ (UPF0313 family)